MPVHKSLYSIISCHFSTKSNLPLFSKIPSKYRPQSIEQAQKAITDYLHTTRSLPFAFAEHIGKNSPFALSKIIRNIEFSVPNFSKSFQRFLRYHPINEFEFFFESIGIDYSKVGGYLPVNKFFFSEDGNVLNAACALSGFGFPWNKLGILYEEEISIFTKNQFELKSRLFEFKEIGFNNVTIIGICLAFPYVLSGESELGDEIEKLLADLKKLFLDFGLVDCVEGNVEAWYDICKKIRVFYDLDCEKGELAELMGKGSSSFLLDYQENVLVQKAEYFSRFGLKKEDVCLLLIRTPEVMNLNLEAPELSVFGLLKHFKLGKNELNHVVEKYPHVLGRNKMVNLPHIMRALNLHVWFFNEIKNGNNRLLANYCLSYPDEDLDKEFREALEKIQFTRTPIHTMNKLKFLHGIGYGESAITIKVLAHLHGTSNELQERFDCLLRMGIEYSKLCSMIRVTPKILNQKPETLEQKVNFLCQEMGSSLQYLDTFPALLCFDLENRIKPRFRFYMWLNEKGLCNRNYSIASMIATSEKNFVARLFGIHPAAPKQWLECYSYK